MTGHGGRSGGTAGSGSQASNTAGSGQHQPAKVIRLVRSPSIGAVEDSYSAHFHMSRSERQPDGILPVEGLRTSRTFQHQPAMLSEVLELLETVPPGLVLDATVGGGGHADAILAAYPDISVLGLDRDEVAVAAAIERLERWGPRAVVVHARFDDLESLSGRQLVGALFDLGVSSAQLDSGERGFSYRQDGPLDMRMDRREHPSAAELVNAIPEDQLVTLLVANGETRFARAIARSILAARPMQTTTQLADAVARAVPAAARRRGHPASRVFQALRTQVNVELDILVPAIDGVIERLVPGGRCIVLSYQSGEDRLVKAAFNLAATGGCTCSRALGCVCGAEPSVRLLNRGARMASEDEVAANPRAASARLRAVERLAAPATGADR